MKSAARVRMPRDPIVVASVIVALLSAAAAIFQAVDNQEYWYPVLLVTVGAIVTAVAKGVPQWRSERRSQAELEAGVHLDDRGHLPVVATTDPTRVFGVRPSAATPLPYLERGPENEIVGVLLERRPVLIVGPPLVGKSRTGVEALKRVGSGLPVWSWKDPTTVAQHLDKSMPSGGVVWFDRLDRYLRVDAINSVRMTLLAKANLIVATMDREAYEDIMRSSDNAGRASLGSFESLVRAQSVLNEFTVVNLPKEPPTILKRIVSALPSATIAERICSVGAIGVYSAGGPVAASALADLHSRFPYSYGLVRSAIDWRRTRIGESIPKDVARRLAVEYARADGLISPADAVPANDDAWRKHEQRASRWLAGPRSLRMIEPTSSHETQGWHPFEYLIEVISSDHPNPAILPQTWREASEAEASKLQLYEAALAADDAGRWNEAIALLRRLVELGVGSVETYIGLIYLWRLEQPRSAEPWLKESANKGDINAIMLLADLYEEASPRKSRLMLIQAARLGNSHAMYQLARLEPAADRQLDWLQAAAEKKHYPAMAHLGRILADRASEGTEAETLLREAATAGDVIGATLFGCFLLHRDRLNEARAWLERGAAAGDAHAMGDLGRMLIEEDPVLAEFWLRKGAEGGYAPSMNNLAAVISNRRPGEAEAWYRRSADQGYVGAMKNLARVLMYRAPDEASDWWRKAASHGDAEALSGPLIAPGEPGF